MDYVWIEFITGLTDAWCGFTADHITAFAVSFS